MSDDLPPPEMTLRVRVQEIPLENAVDLLDVLHPASGLFRGSQLYRGQADSSRGLVPSVFREDAPFLLSADRFLKNQWVYGSQVKRALRWAPSAEIERPANAFNNNLRAQ